MVKFLISAAFWEGALIRKRNLSEGSVNGMLVIWVPAFIRVNMVLLKLNFILKVETQLYAISEQLQILVSLKTCKSTASNYSCRKVNDAINLSISTFVIISSFRLSFFVWLFEALTHPKETFSIYFLHILTPDLIIFNYLDLIIFSYRVLKSSFPNNSKESSLICLTLSRVFFPLTRYCTQIFVSLTLITLLKLPKSIWFWEYFFKVIPMMSRDCIHLVRGDSWKLQIFFGFKFSSQQNWNTSPSLCQDFLNVAAPFYGLNAKLNVTRIQLASRKSLRLNFWTIKGLVNIKVNVSIQKNMYM